MRSVEFCPKLNRFLISWVAFCRKDIRLSFVGKSLSFKNRGFNQKLKKKKQFNASKFKKLQE